MFGGNQAARDAARLSRLEQLEKWRAEEAKDRQAKLAAAGGVPMTTGGNRSRRAEENLDDPSKPRFSIELTFLMAVRDRDLALATRLLKKGANPKAANQYGVSPLHLAVANDDRSMIEFLVNNGADIEAPDQDGFTPLHSAAHYGNNKGACVGGGGAREPWPPPAQACLTKRGSKRMLASLVRSPALQILVDEGANLIAVNSDNEIPLEVAEFADTCDLLRSTA